jgi:hypothetical protein
MKVVDSVAGLTLAPRRTIGFTKTRLIGSCKNQVKLFIFMLPIAFNLTTEIANSTHQSYRAAIPPR